MWQTLKILQPSPQFHHLPQPAPPTPTYRQQQQWRCHISRRELTLFTTPSFLLLPAAEQSSLAVVESTTTCTDINNDNNLPTTNKAFLDISINNEPIGRIILSLNPSIAPIGVARFTSLISGKAGISYRRKEFVKILPNYLQHAGVRSYGVDAEMGKIVGNDLSAEWESLNSTACGGTKNLAGSVGIIVRDPTKPPPNVKLVAKNGKLVVNEEEVKPDPNGTEFVITMKDSPELDSSVLVIGRVLEGMEVVKKIGEVKTVNENTTSPYFRVAKLIGDKRAVVAERGFNRPYSKIVVSNCGLLD
ncbi:peptidyl-prolyl cis-trans isomerase CYP26-2, chloroplastic [Impatiens glandulifera]|uniref:peptidyl-prolyl cis-trans isomerase CYP26-2, chloroplastic n=1 Tax=Impatiens glandulifera TaxID=253017 RepID=UPI001FB148DA|nr:peptidyl-prolyl cis-trans isomerase CYP26-2, chloroplastic [Impatiens glandulifera]